MSASLHALLAFAMLAILGQAQYFPLEIAETIQRDSFCSAQPQGNDSVRHEYLVYYRMPTTASDLMQGYDTSQVLEASILHRNVLRRVYEHPLILRMGDLSRGIVSPGEEARTQRFFVKLLAGAPVTVVTLGGSISAGHGTDDHEEDSWPSRVYAWIQDTFPHEEHRLLNVAIPATTSSFIEPCISTLLPEGDIDLIFMEYTMNDSAEDQHGTTAGQMDAPARRTMERLVRGLLSLPSSPALVGLHAWSPHAAYAGDRNHFGGSEDMLSKIYSYYGATVLSFRDLMVPILRQHPTLAADIWKDDKELHPNCVGTRYMADMIIGFFMDKLAQAAWIQHVRAVQHFQNIPDLVMPVEEVAPLPRPLFHSNAAPYTTLCIMEESLASHVTNSSGFFWENEGTPESPKWGYVSTSLHSYLVFQVPLDNVNFNNETNKVVLGLGVLASWSRQMGVGTLGCLEGCECEAKDFSTYLAYAEWSMTFWEFLQAKVAPGSTICSFYLLNAPKTYSQGHKLKVSHLLVSGNMHTLGARVTWVEEGIISSPQLPPADAGYSAPD